MAKAVLYRMELPDYKCGYGTAARDLLRREKFEIEEHVLRTRRDVDALKAKYRIKTTPLVFIEGERIGGFTDLRKHLKSQKPKSKRFWQR